MGLSREDVQEIIALLDELDATELHLRTRHFALWLRRSATGPGPADPGRPAWVQASEVRDRPRRLDDPPEPAAAGPDRAAGEDATAGEDRAVGQPPVPEQMEVAGLVAVRTPMMGTFYRAPKPGDPPFVEIGSRVAPETVVGIVETMKLMNSVAAGVRGRVAEICLGNAELAPPGAVLMRIAPE